MIEIVHVENREHPILVIDEEGKLNNKPINRIATLIYSNPYDIIVGDALLCESTEIR